MIYKIFFLWKQLHTSTVLLSQMLDLCADSGSEEESEGESESDDDTENELEGQDSESQDDIEGEGIPDLEMLNGNQEDDGEQASEDEDEKEQKEAEGADLRQAEISRGEYYLWLRVWQSCSDPHLMQKPASFGDGISQLLVIIVVRHIHVVRKRQNKNARPLPIVPVLLTHNPQTALKGLRFRVYAAISLL